MNTYKITFEPYDRYESCKTVNRRFKAPSDRDALLVAHPWIGSGCLSKPDEDELEDYEGMSEKAIVEDIEEYNGDGCDYLTKLVNETTGKVLFGDKTPRTMTWDEL